jgi:Tol biopolymer transport system component
MKRTALASGIILPALVGVLPACDDPFTCPASFTDCGGICIDVAVDETNCGACGTTCDTDESCVANACVPNLVCNAPEENCGNVCINTQTSAANCGGCGDACAGGFDECVAGQCAAPLVAIHTVFETKGTFDRDLYVLQDRTFDLTRLNTGDFFSDRVTDYAVLPDGRVLMVATLDENLYELYVATPNGELTKISGTPPANFGGVLRGLAVSADGSRVLYRADVDGLTELYTIALTATPGAPVKISGPLIEGGGVSSSYALSADGTTAVYLAAQDTSTTELYYVDLSAATPAASVKINDDTNLGVDGVWDFVLAADGFRVVYRAENPGLGRIQLYTVHVTRPGTADIITYADGAEGTVTDYRLSPDGTSLAFSAYDDFGLWDEALWYLDLVAPYDATLVVDTPENQTAGLRDDFEFTPDGNTLVYRKIDDETFGFDRLYRVDVTDPANPGTPELLSSDGMTSADEATDFAISPDGTTVVFRGGADGAEGNNPFPGSQGPELSYNRAPMIYAVDLTAATPAPVAISTEVPIDHQGIAGGYVITGDSTRVVFGADYDNAFLTDAYMVALEGTIELRKVGPTIDETTDASDVDSFARF